MTTPCAPHAWVVMEDGRPLFHTPGSYPPEYRVDAALEALWREGQERLRWPKGRIIQLELFARAA